MEVIFYEYKMSTRLRQVLPDDTVWEETECSSSGKEASMYCMRNDDVHHWDKDDVRGVHRS